MPVTQDRLTRLREFGLSEYAARAYLALLDLGIAEARDVSSISKVPQAKIYHVLEQLHEKGLVVVLPEFPKKYAPVPFVEYLDRLYEEHTRAAGTIEKERDDLAELFRVVGDTEVGDRGFFTVLRGRRNVLAKIEEMLANARRDLLMLGTAGGAARTAKLLPDIRRARERGVTVRLLAPLDEPSLASYQEVRPHAEVRARELHEGERSAKVAIVVADGKAAFLIHFVPDDASLVAGKDIGVFTDQEAMVSAIQALVEPHWSRASGFDERKAGIETGRDAPFVRIYADEAETWRAVDHALARGVDEVCAVDGHATAEGAPAKALLERLRDGRARFRGVLNLPDLDAVDAYARSASPGAQIRHLAPRLVARKWLLDDREAFFSLPRGAGSSDLVVHTNHAAVVSTLRGHFESLWDSASPLATRRKELETFPLLRPADLGLDAVFDALRDAVLVAEEDGSVLLGNPAASRLLGRDARHAPRARLADLLQGDLAPPAADAPDGERRGRALRADGSSIEIEYSVRRVPGADRPLRVVVARPA